MHLYIQIFEYTNASMFRAKVSAYGLMQRNSHIGLSLFQKRAARRAEMCELALQTGSVAITSAGCVQAEATR